MISYLINTCLSRLSKKELILLTLTGLHLKMSILGPQCNPVSSEKLHDIESLLGINLNEFWKYMLIFQSQSLSHARPMGSFPFFNN